MDAITVSGWVMTALSLALAVVQTYRVKRLAKRNKEQLEMFIEDADYVSFEHDDPMLFRFLVSSHQRGCDLYRSLVDFYLSSERRFTYADLKRVCQTTLITYRWQEEFWKARVAMRPENRKTEVPSESFLPENQSARRFRAVQARDAEQGRDNVSGSGH